MGGDVVNFYCGQSVDSAFAFSSMAIAKRGKK